MDRRRLADGHIHHRGPGDRRSVLCVRYEPQGMMTKLRTEPYPDPMAGVRAYRSDELLDHILVLDYRIQNALVCMDNQEIVNPELSEAFHGIRLLLQPEVKR